MILKKSKPIPEYAKKEIESMAFLEEGGFFIRRCVVPIDEKDAITYVHPESFDFSEVYGDCELMQVIKEKLELPVMISKFQFEKNVRSFEQEAADQTHQLIAKLADVQEQTDE